jgi:phage FluMu protein Com
MSEGQMDVSFALMLDGNSVGGLLAEAFGVEMTGSPCQCAHCGAVGAMATLLAFTQAPGVVLRCPRCEQVVLRMVTTAEVIYLDVRGAAYVKVQRRAS